MAKATEATPSVTYHPAAVRALQAIKDKLTDLMRMVDEAIVTNPPPFVPPPAVPSPVIHGTVKADFASVYDTPDENAKTRGSVAQGAVLPIALELSTSGGFTWYRVTAGEFKGGYVQGQDLTLQ
jgi:hypothetical protein